MLMMRSSILGAAIVLIAISAAALAQEKDGAVSDSAAEARAKFAPPARRMQKNSVPASNAARAAACAPVLRRMRPTLSAECKAARNERGALRAKDRG